MTSHHIRTISVGRKEMHLFTSSLSAPDSCWVKSVPLEIIPLHLWVASVVAPVRLEGCWSLAGSGVKCSYPSKVDGVLWRIIQWRPVALLMTWKPKRHCCPPGWSEILGTHLRLGNYLWWWLWHQQCPETPAVVMWTVQAFVSRSHKKADVLNYNTYLLLITKIVTLKHI